VVQEFFTSREFGNRLTQEPKRAVIAQRERVIYRVRYPGCTVGEFARKRLERRGPKGFTLRRAIVGFGNKLESNQTTNRMSLDKYIACRRNFRFEHRILSKSPHQYTGATIHKSLCQTLVQSIRQSIFYLSRDLLPMQRIA